jgi:hypothetical protein
VGGENGGDVGRNLGDCFPEDDLGDANVECDNGVVKASPCVSCLNVIMKICIIVHVFKLQLHTLSETLR